jgi:hypothetical protein
LVNGLFGHAARAGEAHAVTNNGIKQRRVDQRMGDLMLRVVPELEARRRIEPKWDSGS